MRSLGVKIIFYYSKEKIDLMIYVWFTLNIEEEVKVNLF